MPSTPLAITTRHRILAAVLQRVSAPLKKADLLTVADHMIRGLSHSQVPVLAKRHKVEANASASEQEFLAKQASKCDEAEISKLLLEISLLDSAYQRSSALAILSWTPQNAIVWIQTKSGKLWPRLLQRNRRNAKQLLRKRQNRNQPSIPRQQALNPTSADFAESRLRDSAFL
jgi:hypothetical protein